MKELGNAAEEVEPALVKWAFRQPDQSIKTRRKAAAAASGDSAQLPVPSEIGTEEESSWKEVRGRKRQALEAKNVKPKAASRVTGKGFDFLKKMGWKEGEGVGRNGQGIVEPIIPKPRLPSDKRGLGFTASKRRALGSNRFAPLENEEAPKIDFSIPLHKNFVKSAQVVGEDPNQVAKIEEALSKLKLDGTGSGSGAEKRDAGAAL